MTEKCLPIVSWLKDWFTSKDEDYHYDIKVYNSSGSKDWNRAIGDTLTVLVTVTDGDGNTVPNHTFTYYHNSASREATTDSNGEYTYDYTANWGGLHQFWVNSDSFYTIWVNAWRTIYNSNGITIDVDEINKLTTIRINKSSVSVSAKSTTNWLAQGTIEAKYCPYVSLTMPVGHANSLEYVAVDYLGKIDYYSGTARSSANIQTIATFKNKC